LSGLPDGADVTSTLGAVAALGCRVERLDSGHVRLEGRAFRFAAPSAVIDCGNSGTTIRLLMGVLAGQRFESSLDGDASLRRRPMERVARPLRAMGAEIRTSSGCAPVTVVGARLRSFDHVLDVASAQVKTALLLAALQADGPSSIREPMRSRDHSERMLRAMGLAIEDRGGVLCLASGAIPDAIDVAVCGDASSAAFFIVAACLVPGSDLTIENVCLNPGRLGFVEVLRRMGADVEAVPRGEMAGEPFGDLRATAKPLRGTRIDEEEIPRCIDELPILAIAAAAAHGATTIRGAGELRVKESDRIATTAEMLRRFGVGVEEHPDGLTVEGRGGASFVGGATIASGGDHRIAMAAGVGGLLAGGATTIEEADAALISFPRFFQSLCDAAG
jgi:3-phosphoshikimate 1-carboxyvinyltransferase